MSLGSGKQTREAVVDALSQLATSGAASSTLVVTAGSTYVTWRRERGARAFIGVAPKSASLPQDIRLSSEAAGKMRTLGWRKPKGFRNWEVEVAADRFDPAQMGEQTHTILAELYGVDDPFEFSLTHDERDHPRNDDVYDAMRTLAKTREGSHRTVLYNALVNATLLVPIRPDADDADDDGEEFLVFEEHMGRPVFGAFTDIDSLRMWNPRPFEYLPVHGSELFGSLNRRRAAALLLNEEGEVGGHLNAHEVDTLARAVNDWKTKHR